MNANEQGTFFGGEQKQVIAGFKKIVRVTRLLETNL